MRSASMLILLAILVTFSAGQVLSQDAINATNATNATMEALNISNATNATIVEAPVIVAEAASIAAPQNDTEAEPIAAPQETASRFTQLSNYTRGTSAVLGKTLPGGYSDVTETADTNLVFSRDAGVPAPSVKVSITDVNTQEDKYVQITNQAVGAWDMTGWNLVSAGSTTFTFPAFSLEDGLSVRVHEGNGFGTATDIFTNNTAPLWIDNIVALQDAAGNIISSYDISAPPAPVVYAVPSLESRIQY